MTNKQKFFQNMHLATMEHNKWLSEIKQLTSGYIDSNLDYKKTFLDTNFYFWFRDIASHLLYEQGLNDLKSIEKMIYHMDGEYISLYNIAIKHRDKNFLGKYKSLESTEIVALEKYYNALNVITDKIEKILTDLEPKIRNLPEDFFEFLTIVQEKEDKNTHDSSTVKQKSNIGARGAYQE